MSTKNVKRSIVFLILATICSLAGTAVAQSEPQQFVVVYVEFKPADAKAGSDVLQTLAGRADNSSGVVRFDVLRQLDRPNFFALFETWTTAQAFTDFQNSSATQTILTQLMPLLEAPLDQRPGNLLAGTVAPRSQHAQAREVFVITHVDVDPQFVGQAEPLLDTFVSDSLNDAGVQAFALLSQTPTTNHFQLFETFANLKAFDAHVSEQHTVDFRTNTAPFLGAPYDERLYELLDHSDSQGKQR
jgi:quinol monooxygenase YgiN